jgi:hypothetical protein
VGVYEIFTNEKDPTWLAHFLKILTRKLSFSLAKIPLPYALSPLNPRNGLQKTLELPYTLGLDILISIPLLEKDYA